MSLGNEMTELSKVISDAKERAKVNPFAAIHYDAWLSGMIYLFLGAWHELKDGKKVTQKLLDSFQYENEPKVTEIYRQWLASFPAMRGYNTFDNVDYVLIMLETFDNEAPNPANKDKGLLEDYVYQIYQQLTNLRMNLRRFKSEIHMEGVKPVLVIPEYPSLRIPFKEECEDGTI